MDTRTCPPGQLLNSEDAAAYLDTTPRHLRRLRTEHGLPCIRLGAKVRYLPSDLDDFVSRSRVTSEAAESQAGAA